MKWEVTGSHRDSGQDMTVVVDAASARDAESAAVDMGVLVIDALPVQSAPAAPAATPPPGPPAIIPRGHRICPNPNCGHIGKPRRKAKGSLLVFFVLLCMFVVPAILYLLFFGGAITVCQKCGNRIDS